MFKEQIRLFVCMSLLCTIHANVHELYAVHYNLKVTEFSEFELCHLTAASMRILIGDPGFEPAVGNSATSLIY